MVYNARLHTILDAHAPLTKKTVTCRETYPWFTTEIQQLKEVQSISREKVAALNEL